MPGSPRLLEERRTRSRSKRHTVLVFDGTLWYGEGTEGTHPYNIVTNPQKGYTVMTKVTPTPGIVEAASAAYMSEPRSRGVDNHMHLIEVAVTAAFNHPETAALFDSGNNSTPTWEPLFPNDPLLPGERVRRVSVEKGVSYIEEGVVGHIDSNKDVWSDMDAFIGDRDYGTWYVLRYPDQNRSGLPTQEGSVIVKKSDKIQARHAGKTWSTSEAVLVLGEWRGTWFEKVDTPRQRDVMWAMSPDRIIPDTWKVDRK